MGEIAPAALLEALYDVCRRLEAAGVLARMHPVWDVSGVPYAMASSRRFLAGEIVSPGPPRRLRIAIAAASRSGACGHGRQCPTPVVPAAGDIEMALFDDACGSLCPWAFASREAYVAHRLLPVVAAASGRAQWALAGLVGVRPSAPAMPAMPVAPLADVLFG